MGTGTQVHDGAASSLPMPAPSLVPVTDDGAHLTVVPHLARLIDTPHAGADGRHADEPTPFRPGDTVGEVSAVCVVERLRPDAGPAGVSAMAKSPVSGRVHVRELGVRGDVQGDRLHHGGPDKAVYALAGAEVRHWGALLGTRPGGLGENLVVEGDLDDLELGAVLHAGSLTLRVTGLRNPCSTLARGVGREGFVAEFSARARVGVYLAVDEPGDLAAGDALTVLSTPGHGVSCRRWYAHHDPRDARALLASAETGKMRMADFTRRYVEAAAHEEVGPGPAGATAPARQGSGA